MIVKRKCGFSCRVWPVLSQNPSAQLPVRTSLLLYQCEHLPCLGASFVDLQKCCPVLLWQLRAARINKLLHSPGFQVDTVDLVIQFLDLDMDLLAFRDLKMIRRASCHIDGLFQGFIHRMSPRALCLIGMHNLIEQVLCLSLTLDVVKVSIQNNATSILRIVLGHDNFVRHTPLLHLGQIQICPCNQLRVFVINIEQEHVCIRDD